MQKEVYVHNKIPTFTNSTQNKGDYTLFKKITHFDMYKECQMCCCMVLFYDKTSKTSFLFFKPSLKNEAITKKYKIHLVLLVHNDIIVKQLTKITRLYYRFTLLIYVK